MKIGILLSGRTATEIIDKYGEYDQFFLRFLADQGLEMQTYAVVDGVFPQSIDEQDGYLITGSRHGVYEDHAWIAPLEQLVRDAYAAKIPMVGICFGHQIMAQALGGVVQKFNGGWAVGTQDYHFDFLPQNPVAVAAWHQDQVITAPACATRVGQNDFCQNAALLYGDQMFSMQAHPEFDVEIMSELERYRGQTLPEGIREQLKSNLTNRQPAHSFAEIIGGFFHRRHLTANTAIDR